MKIEKAVISEVVQTIGSLISIFVFFTGFSSIPGLLGGVPLDTNIVGFTNFSVLPVDLQIGFILIGVPIFNLINAWFTISIAKIVLYFLAEIRVEMCDSPIIIIVLLLVLLPITIGINIIFLAVLFENIMSNLSIAIGIVSVITTSCFVFFWMDNNANNYIN